VQFRYAVLDVRRSWFTRNIYEADDWRLRKDDQSVSQGDGVGGEIPAYVSSVYLVKLEELRTDVKPSPPGRPVTPRPLPFPVLVGGIKPAVSRPGTQPVIRPAIASHLSLAAGPRAGVLRNSVALEARPRATTHVAANPLARATRLPGVQLRNARFGAIQRIHMADIRSRLTLAGGLVADGSRPPTGTSTPSREIYVVGFGCHRLPASPTPNPNYQWPTSPH
jgi:hypothetical protein